MLTADHFLSQLAAIASRAAADIPDNKWIAAEFIRLVSPSIGRVPAANLAFTYLFEKRPSPDVSEAVPVVPAVPAADSEDKARRLLKLGYIVAFFLGQYDDDSMDLEKEDWQNIRSILEEASDEINIDTLTIHMGNLLEHGAL
jgi:hypothetical protein